VTEHLRRFGYDEVQLKVDALSSSQNNARQIRDAIMAMPLPPGAPRLVLVGYWKGAPDALEAVVAYPEIRRPRGRGGQRRWRGSRVAAGEGRRAVPGRAAAVLSRLDLRRGRSRRRRQPQTRDASGLARAESASSGTTLLLARRVPAAEEHIPDSLAELQQACALTRATTVC